MLLYHTYGKLKSLGVFLSTTAAKYFCIASGTAVVSYKKALRVLPIMGGFTNDGGNFTSAIKGLKKFYARNCKVKKGSKDTAEQKKCSVNKTTSHDDAECNAQGAPRPSENDSAHIASSAALLSASSPPANDDEKPSLNFHDFDKGFAFSGLVAGSDVGVFTQMSTASP